MAKVSKTEVDKKLRDEVFEKALIEGWNLDTGLPVIREGFVKINDRQYGILLTDANGEQRYVRLGAIVAEQREDMTAEELMQAEIDAYQTKQDEKAEKAKKRAEKAAKDKAEREAKKAAEGE